MLWQDIMFLRAKSGAVAPG